MRKTLVLIYPILGEDMRTRVFLFLFSVLLIVASPGVALASEAEDVTIESTQETIEDSLFESLEERLENTDTQVTDIVDYTEILNRLNEQLKLNNELMQYAAGFLLFVVIVIICYLAYKFFNMFF